VWSPEHLLAAAVLACVKTTFDAFARIRGLPVYGWFGRVVATLERGARGPKFTSIRVELNITTELGEETRLRETVAAVESACIVARALAVPVEIVTTVTTQPVDIAC
jgi:organic hydroperoxide reductase OsmC/OhrA